MKNQHIYRKSIKNRIADWFWTNEGAQYTSIIAGLTFVFTLAGAVVTFVNLFWWGIGDK